MKKLIVLSLLTVMLLVGGTFSPAHAQTPGNDLKPTFISPTPGLYVNGWPAFTVSYPKEWVEVPSVAAGDVFMAAYPRQGTYPSPVLAIGVFPSPLPLEEWAKLVMPTWVNIFTDIKVLSDKPSELKDGTPAREVEVEFVPNYDALQMRINNAPKHNGLLLETKKNMTWVEVWLSDDRGRIGEDLKKYSYSLTFQAGREEPVKVPPDVRAFLDMYCVDLMSHDVKTIMEHFSDRLRHSGGGKVSVEQYFRNDPTSPIHTDVISEEAIVTVFEPHGDKAYIDGFFLEKIKGDANSRKMPMYGQQIINEHGEWKFFGNQK